MLAGLVRAILDQRNFVDGFLTSLQVGVFAMLAGLVIGVPASLGLARYRFRGRESLGLLLLLPLVVAGVVAGTAMYVFQIEDPLSGLFTVPFGPWPDGRATAGLRVIVLMVQNLLVSDRTCRDPKERVRDGNPSRRAVSR